MKKRSEKIHRAKMCYLIVVLPTLLFWSAAPEICQVVYILTMAYLISLVPEYEIVVHRERDGNRKKRNTKESKTICTQQVSQRENQGR
jgi:uncharacterized membrane protein YhaH (DUF805 family)